MRLSPNYQNPIVQKVLQDYTLIPLEQDKQFRDVYIALQIAEGIDEFKQHERLDLDILVEEEGNELSLIRIKPNSRLTQDLKWTYWNKILYATTLNNHTEKTILPKAFVQNKILEIFAPYTIKTCIDKLLE